MDLFRVVFKKSLILICSSTKQALTDFVWFPWSLLVFMYLISIKLTCIKYNTIYNLYVVMIALQRSNLAIRKGLTFGHAHPCLDAFITFTTDLQQDRHRWMQSREVQHQNGSRKNSMFISYLTYLWYYNLFAWVNSVFVVAKLLCCCIWK